MKLYLDPGHGGKDPGASGNGLKEKDVVLDIAKRIRNQLHGYSKVIVKMSRTTDRTISLRERTNEANRWGADIFLSIHCNAFNGSIRGYEDFVYNGLKHNARAIKYQSLLHETITKQNRLPNRGKKQANFHVLRESAMPALLTENGFIDHPQDAKLMRQITWKESIAKGHADGLVHIFQLEKKKQAHPAYAAVAGSFQKKTNAEGRALLLESIGFPAQIHKVTVKSKLMYRVCAGIYGNKAAARKQVQRLNHAGVESFILNTRT